MPRRRGRRGRLVKGSAGQDLRGHRPRATGGKTGRAAELWQGGARIDGGIHAGVVSLSEVPPQTAPWGPAGRTSLDERVADADVVTRGRDSRWR
eukprot:6532232-Pyramimonas_sp.AAC.1